MITDVRDDTIFDAIPRNGPVLIFLHQEGCPGCLALKPEIERLAALYPSLPVIRALVRDNALLRIEFGVRRVPSIFALRRQDQRTVAWAEVPARDLGLAFQMAAGGS